MFEVHDFQNLSVTIIVEFCRVLQTLGHTSNFASPLTHSED